MKKLLLSALTVLSLLMAVALGAATTKVTTAIWSGETVLGNWTGYVVLSAEQVSKFEPGDQLLVSVKDVIKEAEGKALYPQVYLQRSDWTDLTPTVKSDLQSDGTVSFTVTEAMCGEITGKGLVVKGCYATLTRIVLQKEVELGGGETDIDKAVKEVWTGNQNISWEEPDKGWAVIPAANFADLSAGNSLRFNIADVKAGAQASVVTSAWKSFVDAPIKNVSAPYYEYTATEEMVTEIKANGFIVSGNRYALTSIEIVDPALLPKVSCSMDPEDIRAWAKGEQPVVRVNIQNLQLEDVKVPVKVILTTDKGESAGEPAQVAEVAPGVTATVTLPLDGLTAGVYHAVVLANAQVVGEFNIAYALEEIKSSEDRQPDFTTFWDKALAQLAATEADYKLTELPEKSGSKRRIYLVEMNSVPDGTASEPVVIRGYYAEPVADGKFQAVITYQGYDSAAYGPDGKPTDPYCPSGESDGDKAEFILSTRGQSINNRAPYTNTYGDWFAFGFGDKDSYYYRGAYMDAIRAIDFVASRDKVDTGRIFAQGQSQGGALTIAAAALDPAKRLRAVAPAVPFMGDFPDYFQVAAWPASVAMSCRDRLGLTDGQMYAFLSYFDTKNLASMISCPVIQAIGLQDNICPPHTNMAPYNNLTVANKKLVVNTGCAHSVPSSWFGQFNDWFRMAIDGMPEYIDITTNIFTGPMPVSWSALALGPELFTYVKSGDKLKVSLSEIAEDRTRWPQLKVTDNSGKDLWPSTPLYDSERGLPAPYEAVYEIDAEKAATLKAGGCKINGTGFTLASVDLTGMVEISTARKDPTKAVAEIWSGSERISWANDDSKNSVLIDKSKFAGMKGGETLRVTMSEVASNAQLRLQANYTQFEPVSNTQLKGACSQDIVFDEAMVKLVQEKGLRCTGCYYTLDKVEIIDPTQNIGCMAVIASETVKAWENGENPCVGVNIQSLEAYDYDVPVTVTLTKDVEPGKVWRTIENVADMKARVNTPVNVELGALEAGFYNMSVSVNGSTVGGYVIGYDPTGIVSPFDGQNDFNDFWADGLAELAKVPGEFSIVEEMESYSTSARKVYYVEMKSIADTEGGEPVIISGYYAEPVAEGVYPCLVHFQGTDGGTSAPWCMSGDANPDWCEFVLSVRGQMLNNRDPHKDRNIYTTGGYSYYTYGLASENYGREHYYFGAYLDCVRAIDFVESRAKVNRRNIFCEGGSQGGAFTYAAAALCGDRIRAAAPGITGHADFSDDFKVAAWPANQILPLAAANGISEEDMLVRLSYFDVKNFAPLVTCPVTTNLSLQDTTDPPHVGFAPFNLLNVDDKEYLVNSLLGHATAPDWSARYMKFFHDRLYKDPAGTEDVAAGRVDSFRVVVNGRQVSSLDGEMFSVSDMAGRIVETGSSAVLLPQPGVYVVSNGGAFRKIVVR